MRIPVWVHDSELGGGTQRHEDFRTWDRAALISGASLALQEEGSDRLRPQER